MVKRAITNAVYMGAVWIIGAVAAIVVVFSLAMIINTVQAQEATPTYEASSGQQDKSLNHPLTSNPPMMYKGPIIVEVVTEPQDCDTHNKKLAALLTSIAKQMVQDPANAHMYNNAIITIHEVACRE